MADTEKGRDAGKGAAVSLSPTLLDRVILHVAPRAGLNRLRARAGAQFFTNYAAGNFDRRTMRGWLTSNASADKSLSGEGETMRQRSRAAYEDIPIATGALKRARTNTVASGLTLMCAIDREILGLSDEDADAWERDTENRFNMWAENQDCDVTRTQNFYELQGLAFISTLMSGDCFTLMPRIKRADMDNDLRLAIFEGDFVSNPNEGMDTDRLAGGVEKDRHGAPQAYHFRTSHPGGFSLSYTWKRILAYGLRGKRRQVIHLFYRDRPGQARGVVFLHSVIESLKQLSRYSESELMAAVIQAFFTAFITQKNPNTNPLADGIATELKVTNPENNKLDENTYEMGSGNIIGLGMDEDVKFADPNRPSAKFDPFFTAVVKQIGSAIEIPFEQLMLHFTASYSAARGAILEAWKFYRERRTWLARNYCKPVYREWLYEEIVNGRIDAPGYFESNYKRYAWERAVWIGPGMGQIDPVKESKAANQKLDDLLTDFDTEHSQIYGTNWETMIRRRQRQEEYLKKLKLRRVRTDKDMPSLEDDKTDPPPEE